MDRTIHISVLSIDMTCAKCRVMHCTSGLPDIMRQVREIRKNQSIVAKWITSLNKSVRKLTPNWPRFVIMYSCFWTYLKFMFHMGLVSWKYLQYNHFFLFLLLEHEVSMIPRILEILDILLLIYSDSWNYWKSDFLSMLLVFWKCWKSRFLSLLECGDLNAP